MGSTLVATRLGNLRAWWTECGVRRLDFVDEPVGAAGFTPAMPPGWTEAIRRAVEGETITEAVPLDLQGTAFQLRIWEALRALPRGKTTTYGELGRSLGLPLGASRAIGAACGANPVAVLVPCHRVVPAGGGLGGYRWGLEIKRRLLELEGASAAVPRETLPFGETVQVARPR